MSDTVKVSIVIPVYNVEQYLNECMESLLSQTLREIEIICVDDGSTDLSSRILDDYAKKDSRLKVLHQKNSGAGAARNRGVMIATGEYIGFVDSDDIVYPTMYEKLYQKAIAYQADMVITGEIETEVGNPIRFPIDDFENRHKVLELGWFDAIDYPDILKNVFLWNRIYKRSFWIDSGLQIPEGRRFAEDVLPCMQSALLAKKIVYVSGPLYWYRNNRKNSLSDTLAKSSQKMDYIVAVEESLRFLKSTGCYSVFQEDFWVFCVHLFAMLQSTIANYEHFSLFFFGMANLLDDSALDMLDKTWLAHAYPQVLRTLRHKNILTLYIKNRLLSLFHIE